jgi:methionyl-tRNA formyltransferase
MRVALITPASRPHSQALCAAIAAEHELVAVLQPQAATRSRAARVRQVRSEVERLGLAGEALRLLGVAPGPVRGWDVRADEDRALARAFPHADRDFGAKAAAVTEAVADVNAPESVERLRALRTDVVCCLGGPIYRPALIGAVPLMLNWHSGVSPLYNGTSTIAFAFANGHLRLCGGTLMRMSAAVDGGDVLAHALPAIEPGDTPGSLFARTVTAAIDAYLAVLRHLAAGGTVTGAPQGEPLFYLRASDWTVAHGHRVRRLVARDAAADAARAGRTETYWDAPDAAAAAARVREVLAPEVGL